MGIDLMASSNVGTNKPYKQPFEDREFAKRAGAKGGKASVKTRQKKAEEKKQYDLEAATLEQQLEAASKADNFEMIREVAAKLGLVRIARIIVHSKDDKLVADLSKWSVEQKYGKSMQRVEQSGNQQILIRVEGAAGSVAAAHRAAVIDVDARPALPA